MNAQSLTIPRGPTRSSRKRTVQLLLPSWGAGIWIAFGFLTLIAAFVVIGAGSALLLAGTWVLSAGISRLLPQRSAAAAWAVGLICEMSVVLALSAVAAAVSPRVQQPPVNLVILIVPVLVGVGLMAIAIRRRRGPAEASLFFDRIAVMITAVVVAGVAVLSSLGSNYALAWAMSGDARNHLAILRTSLDNGGLTVDQLRSYPAAINAIAAVVAGSTPRAALAPGDLLLHDVQALAGVYVVLVIAVACLIVAAIAAFISRRTTLRGSSALGMSVLLLVASATAVSPLLLGTTLRDGFFSAYGGLAIALASVVIGMSALASTSCGPLINSFLAAATVLLFATWTILAIVPATLSVTIVVVLILRSRRTRAAPVRQWARIAWVVLLAIPVLVAAGTGAVSLANHARLEAAFRFGGSITPPDPLVLPILALGLLSIAMVGKGINRLLVIALLIVVVTGAGTVVWLEHLPAGWRHLTETYYSQKTLWLVVSALVWVPFVPFVLVAERLAGPVRRVRAAVALGLASLVVLLSLTVVTTVPDPLAQAFGGWQQPTAATVTAVATEANSRRSFVVWDYSSPGDDRLGNFWAALMWDTTDSGQTTKGPVSLPGGLMQWAYGETGQNIEELCPVLAAYPRITVTTRSPDTLGRLRQACGAGSYHVDVVTVPSG